MTAEFHINGHEVEVDAVGVDQGERVPLPDALAALAGDWLWLDLPKPLP